MPKYRVRTVVVADFYVEAESGPLAEDVIYDAWEYGTAWFQFEIPKAVERGIELKEVTAREAWERPAGQL